MYKDMLIEVHQSRDNLPVLVNVSKVNNIEKMSWHGNCIIWLEGGLKIEPIETYDEVKQKIDANLCYKTMCNEQERERYEVVYTKLGENILDIGLRTEDKILARCDQQYGDCGDFRSFVKRWIHSGVYLSMDEWWRFSRLSMREEKCKYLGMPFYSTNNE